MNSISPVALPRLVSGKSSPELPRANVLGVGIHAIDLPRAVEIIESALLEGRRGYVCVTGVHGVMEAQRRPDFRKVLERAILVAPDGMPTVWVGKWQGHAQMQRVFGPDLMRQLCRRSQTTGYTHFLFGGRPGVAGELEANLKRWFPEIRILGTYTPPFGPLSCQEQSELENKLAALAPDIIWVGLSTPKQELFMAANLARLRCRVMIGVGAAFDIHTGRLQDSPDWVKIAGLQWLHRLAQEPWRLWRRYLVNNSTFLWRLAFQLTRLRNYDLGPTNTTRDET